MLEWQRNGASVQQQIALDERFRGDRPSVWGQLAFGSLQHPPAEAQIGAIKLGGRHRSSSFFLCAEDSTTATALIASLTALTRNAALTAADLRDRSEQASIHGHANRAETGEIFDLKTVECRVLSLCVFIPNHQAQRPEHLRTS
jgi:hypothetical protein